MDKFNFNKLVENPFLVKSDHVKALQKIVEVYPYCQPARILLTKAMHLAGNLNYEKTLNQTSAGMIERQKLKYWINNTGESNDIVAETHTEIAKPALAPLSLNRVYRGPDRTPPAEDLFKSVEENLLALRQTRNKAAGLEDEEAIVSVPQVNIFEKILPFEQLPPITEKKEEKTPFIKRNKKELPQGLINDFVKTETTSREFLSNPFKPAMENVEFFDYKDYKEAQKQGKQHVPSKDQEKINDIAQDFPESLGEPSSGMESSSMGESISEQTEAEMLLNYLEHTKKKKRVQSISKEKVNAILSRFIQEEPTIKPASQSLDNLTEEDLSHRSTRLQAVPPSENFAELLALQGKFARAIDVFEELVLKYPEKKHYFATRIEELKHKLDS